MTDSRVSAEEFCFRVVFGWPYGRDDRQSADLIDRLITVIEEMGGFPQVSSLGPNAKDALEAAEARAEKAEAELASKKARLADVIDDGVFLIVKRLETERDALRDEVVRLREALRSIASASLGPFEPPKKNETPADSAKRLLYNKVNQLAVAAGKALSSTPQAG